MTEKHIIDTPSLELFSIDELHRLGLMTMLQRMGIKDPQAYLADNAVDYVSAFKQNVGMAITITGIKPRPKKVTTNAAAADE